MAKTHPHIDSPTLDDLRELTQDRPESIRETYLALHELIVETLPDVQNSADTVDQAIGYGAHQYGYNGWGMCLVAPFSKWVSLTLLRGADLEDPSGLLEGTNKRMRHLRLTDPSQVATNHVAIQALLREASSV